MYQSVTIGFLLKRLQGSWEDQVSTPGILRESDVDSRDLTPETRLHHSLSAAASELLVLEIVLCSVTVTLPPDASNCCSSTRLTGGGGVLWQSTMRPSRMTLQRSWLRVIITVYTNWCGNTYWTSGPILSRPFQVTPQTALTSSWLLSPTEPHQNLKLLSMMDTQSLLSTCTKFLSFSRALSPSISSALTSSMRSGFSLLSLYIRTW